jgi:hypothetical protein
LSSKYRADCSMLPAFQSRFPFLSPPIGPRHAPELQVSDRPFHSLLRRTCSTDEVGGLSLKPGSKTGWLQYQEYAMYLRRQGSRLNRPSAFCPKSQARYQRPSLHLAASHRTLPIKAENKVLRPSASTKVSQFALPAEPDMA